MSFRWNPSSGPRPFRSPRQRPSKSPPSTPEPLSRFSHKIKARYIVGADGALIEVGRDPEIVEPVVPEPPPASVLGLRGVGIWPAPDDDPDDERDDEYREAEPRPPLPSEFMAGPITGWRYWRVHEDTGLLTSVSFGAEWSPGVPMSGDPEPGNGSGVYAMKSRDLLDGSYDERGRFMVMGKVALWGKIIEHAKGYRAQYGYPLEIDMRTDAAPMPGFPRPRFLDNVAEQIRARYGCVVLTGERDLMERHITRD